MKRRRRFVGFCLGLTSAAIAVALFALASPLTFVGHPLTGLADGLTDDIGAPSDGAMLLALGLVTGAGGVAGIIASHREWGIPVALLLTGVGCLAIGELGAGGMAWGIALIGSVVYSTLVEAFRRQAANPGKRHLVRFSAMAVAVAVVAGAIAVQAG